MDKILTIIGPTAIGKTSLSIEIAKQLNGEIIGLDSRQIYFGMTIGTAQPSIEEQSGVPHHLIGIRSPDEIITAGEYAKLVNAVIIDVKERGKVPIICGGAGLYYRALREGIFEGSMSDIEIRKKLEHEYDSNPKSLLNRLIDIDPEYAKIVHINNKKRLVRAVEIFEITGQTPTEHYLNQKDQHELKQNLFTVLLTMDKDILFDRICKRTEMMIEIGLIEEVKTLLSKYSKESVHPLDSIGYRQVILYLEGKMSEQEMIDDINLRTRQFVKKQMTWFKSEPIDLEIDLTDHSNYSKIIEKVISNYMLVS